MLYSALGFFALAALLGLYLLSFLLSNKNIPKSVALTHGFFALIGIMLLIIYPLYHHISPMVSLVLFLIAVAGGLLLFYRDLTGKKMPILLAVGHAFAAIIAFLLLLVFILTR